TGDIDLCQFILLMCVPQVRIFTQETFQQVQDERKTRFLNRLLYCRKNLLDGLTAEQQECKAAVQVHYKNIREFVWDIRDFLNLHSISSKRDPLVRQLADWDSEIATPSEQVGGFYFAVCAQLLFTQVMEDYSNFKPCPVVQEQVQKQIKRPIYRSSNIETEFEVVPPPSQLPLTNNKDLCRGLDLHELVFYKQV